VTESNYAWLNVQTFKVYTPGCARLFTPKWIETNYTTAFSGKVTSLKYLSSAIIAAS